MVEFLTFHDQNAYDRNSYERDQDSISDSMFEYKHIIQPMNDDRALCGKSKHYSFDKFIHRLYYASKKDIPNVRAK